MADINNINKMIAKAIIDCQISSDAGKRISSIEDVRARGARYKGYQLKVVFILRAIKLINSSKSAFRYYVTETDDQNGYPSIIVYFTTKVDGEKIQMSFHTPLNKAKELLPYVGKGTTTYWDRKKGGSRDGAELLAKLYGIK
jgi:hypothetical protein